jgi:kynurenine formamidase
VKIVDLSHNVRSGMTQRFAGPIPTIFDHDVRRGKEYEAIDDCCVLQNHLGTHIDAPRHYNPRKGIAVHELPLERLITSAVVLNLTHKEPLSSITVEDLEAALKVAKEEVRPNDAVLLHTGMAAYYDSWDSEKWEESEYARYPSISEPAVRWLLARQIALIGMDTLAPDRSPDSRPTHQILLRDNNIPIVENLCNLEKLTKSRVLFIGLPPKIVGASGFLIRAVAIEDFDGAAVLGRA